MALRGALHAGLIQLMRTLIPPERQAAVASSVVITARLAQADAEGIHR
jgi:hypothetical protein